MIYESLLGFNGMDFLDPKAKKRHRIRLVIGYGLVATLIATATAILVYQAYGFDVDRRTGEVIQNGLVFVDSAPDKARVFLNGQQHKDQTNTKMALPSGTYNIKIQKDGYRAWQRTFELEGGTVERLTYPLLIPDSLQRQELSSFNALPTFASGSPDRRWVVVAQGNSLTNFTEYDLNALNNDKPDERSIRFASSIFTAAAGAHSLSLVEWSTDNKHILVQHNFTGGHEFIILNREEPGSSFNINQQINQKPTSLTLFNKKFDQWHLYTQPGGLLQVASIKSPTPTTIASNVVAYKSHGDDTILYAQALNKKTNRVFLRQGSDTYVLRDVAAGRTHLDLARYDNAWYVVVASDAEKKAFIYKDPQIILRGRDGSRATPKAALRAEGNVDRVLFSQNTRFISLQSGQKFGVYDAELDKTYRFALTDKFDDPRGVIWMDGHRLLARSDKKLVIVDFDGSNKQTLIPAASGLPVFFDRDFTALYAIDQQSSSPVKYGFYANSLRLEADK